MQRVVWKTNLRNFSVPAGSWVRASARYAKGAGSVPGQGTYKIQPMGAEGSGTANHCFSPSLPQFLPLSNQINKLFLKKRLFENSDEEDES